MTPLPASLVGTELMQKDWAANQESKETNSTTIWNSDLRKYYQEESSVGEWNRIVQKGKRTSYKENKRYKEGKQGCKNEEFQVT